MKSLSFWLTIMLIAFVQSALCYEALVCRGYPPLSEAGLYKKLAAPCFFWLPAIFGDRTSRFRGLIATSAVSTCLYVMISLNGMMRPSIGHLMGVIGIIQTHFIEIVLYTVIFTPFAFAIMYLPERVFGDAWRALCLRPADGSRHDGQNGNAQKLAQNPK